MGAEIRCVGGEGEQMNTLCSLQNSAGKEGEGVGTWAEGCFPSVLRWRDWEIPWRSIDYGSELSLSRLQVQSLVRELRFLQATSGSGKKKKKKRWKDWARINADGKTERERKSKIQGVGGVIEGRRSLRSRRRVGGAQSRRGEFSYLRRWGIFRREFDSGGTFESLWQEVEG